MAETDPLDRAGLELLLETTRAKMAIQESQRPERHEQLMKVVDEMLEYFLASHPEFDRSDMGYLILHVSSVLGTLIDPNLAQVLGSAPLHPTTGANLLSMLGASLVVEPS